MPTQSPAAAPDSAPEANYAVWDAPRWTRAEFAALPPRERGAYLALCAHLAPSSHNTQPWALRLDPAASSIAVFLDRGTYETVGGTVLDRRRVLPASDGTGRQACLSLGCALANLTAAARYFGLAPEVALSPVAPEAVQPLAAPDGPATARYTRLATVHLSAQAHPPAEDPRRLAALFTRRMCRHKYRLELRLPEAIPAACTALAAEHGVRLQLLTRQRMADRLRIPALAELQYQADAHVANDPAFLQELGAWFLPNETPAALGMPGATFGLQAAQARKFHEGFSGRCALDAEDRAGLARAGKAGVESAALVGIIRAVDTPHGAVQAGQALGAIALLLEYHEIQMAVYAGLAEVDWVWRSLDDPAAAERIMIVFRAGYTSESAPHSPRLPLDQILL